MSIEEQISQFRNDYTKLKSEIGKVIVGHEDIVDGTLIAVFAGGMSSSKAFRVWVKLCWCEHSVRLWTFPSAEFGSRRT